MTYYPVKYINSIIHFKTNKAMINQVKQFIKRITPGDTLHDMHTTGRREALADVLQEIERLEAIEARKIKFTSIDNDINGNPRYVCHFHALMTDREKDTLKHPENYNAALRRAHKLGGRKYNNKKYGGGIVFQSYNLDNLTDHINKLRDEAGKD